MEQALLLNASYEPLKVVHWQKAVTLWCQGKVEIIAVHDREVRAVSFSFKLPSVIRLLRFVKIRRPYCAKMYCTKPLQSKPEGLLPPFRYGTPR